MVRSIHVQGASGPSLSSTWCVSQMASAAVSAPSSLALTGAARLRKSCRIFNETVTSASSSFWGITLMKKPILLDFLKATTLWRRQRDQVDSCLTLVILCVRLCVSVSERINLLWVILEVLRFGQFIILSSSILSSQNQLLAGYYNLKETQFQHSVTFRLLDKSALIFFWGGGGYLKIPLDSKMCFSVLTWVTCAHLTFNLSLNSISWHHT